MDSIRIPGNVMADSCRLSCDIWQLVSAIADIYRQINIINKILNNFKIYEF